MAQNRSGVFRNYRNQMGILLLTALSAYIVSTFYFQLMVIQGESMYPAYHNFQPVIVDKHTRDFLAGDVIAFQCETVGALLVKRIAAVPGDTVLIRDGILYVNGLPDAGTWAGGNISYAGIAENPVTLSEDEFFVLGDNHERSRDSRYEDIGCVKCSSIIGEVMHK